MRGTGAVLWLAMVTLAQQQQPAIAQAPTTTSLPVLERRQWDFASGFCGEASLQTALLAKGVWVGQWQARTLAGAKPSADLLLLGASSRSSRSLDAVAHLLGAAVGSQLWDGRLPAARQAQSVWLKSNLLAGHCCIISVSGRSGPANDYDHIVPVIGISRPSPPSAGFSPSDNLTLLDLFSGSHSYSMRIAPPLWDTQARCSIAHNAGGGCLNTDAFNWGVAVQGVRPLALFKPSPSLEVAAWLDPASGAPLPTPPRGQPLPSASGAGANATWTLDLSRTARDGEAFRLWRFDGVQALRNTRAGAPALDRSTGVALLRQTHTGGSNPATLQQLDERCAAAGARCRVRALQMGPQLRACFADPVWTAAQWGTVASEGVTYFLATAA